MRARRKAKAKNVEEHNTPPSDDQNLVDSLVELQLNDDLAKNDFEMLKLALVNEGNISEIKLKLKSTIEYRKKLMKIPETDVLECFPYLFIHPQLVNTKRI